MVGKIYLECFHNNQKFGSLDRKETSEKSVCGVRSYLSTFKLDCQKETSGSSSSFWTIIG